MSLLAGLVHGVRLWRLVRSDAALRVSGDGVLLEPTVAAGPVTPVLAQDIVDVVVQDEPGGWRVVATLRDGHAMALVPRVLDATHAAAIAQWVRAALARSGG